MHLDWMISPVTLLTLVTQVTDCSKMLLCFNLTFDNGGSWCSNPPWFQFEIPRQKNTSSSSTFVYFFSGK